MYRQCVYIYIYIHLYTYIYIYIYFLFICLSARRGRRDGLRRAGLPLVQDVADNTIVLLLLVVVVVL